MEDRSRAWLDRPLRRIAQSVGTLAVAFWPAIALAGPPMLPAATGAPGSTTEQVAPSTLVAIRGADLGSAPLQRPDGMGDPAPPSPAAPPATEIGPQPLELKG
jgi:hypothetical protein